MSASLTGLCFPDQILRGDECRSKFESVLQISQLEQLELLGSCGLSHTHLNSHTPSQDLPSHPALWPKGPDGQPDPTPHPDPGTEHAPGMQQQSNGRGKQGCVGDIQAVGRLVVQLFQGRMIHHRASDHRQVESNCC